MHFQGGHFIKYVIDAAHAAKVPIAVHLDHCISDEDVQLALTLPFDSMMIDASTREPELNIVACKGIMDEARWRGMTVEAEMGRIEGGEDGLPSVDMGSVFTEPDEAREFLEKTRVHFLAPSFGNIHGNYPAGGAEASWQLDRLIQIRNTISKTIPLVLHGTHPVSDELLLKAMECGVTKINLNRTVRDEYTAFVAENAGKMELTVLKMKGVEVYTKSVGRIMDVLGSSNKV